MCSDLGPYVTALSSYCKINYGVTTGGLESFLWVFRKGDMRLSNLHRGFQGQSFDLHRGFQGQSFDLHIEFHPNF